MAGPRAAELRLFLQPPLVLLQQLVRIVVAAALGAVDGTLAVRGLHATGVGPVSDLLLRCPRLDQAGRGLLQPLPLGGRERRLVTWCVPGLKVGLHDLPQLSGVLGGEVQLAGLTVERDQHRLFSRDALAGRGEREVIGKYELEFLHDGTPVKVSVESKTGVLAASRM